MHVQPVPPRLKQNLRSARGERTAPRRTVAHTHYAVVHVVTSQRDIALTSIDPSDDLGRACVVGSVMHRAAMACLAL